MASVNILARKGLEEGMKDEPFTIEQGVWKATENGKVIPAEFNSKGAAQAGIAVEKYRRGKQIRESGRELQSRAGN